ASSSTIASKSFRRSSVIFVSLVHLAIGRFAHRLGLVHLRQRLAANLLRPSQVATGRIVPLTGLLGLLDLVVVAEVEPLQTSGRITHLDIGREAKFSRREVRGEDTELWVGG